MESTPRQFRRLIDGVIGVGFIQTGTGIAIAAIAWPEGEPRRYPVCDLDGYAIELVEIELVESESVTLTETTPSPEVVEVLGDGIDTGTVSDSAPNNDSEPEAPAPVTDTPAPSRSKSKKHKPEQAPE